MTDFLILLGVAYLALKKRIRPEIDICALEITKNTKEGVSQMTRFIGECSRRFLCFETT